MGANLPDGLFQRGGHLLMHQNGVVTFDEIRRVPVADEQRFQLLVADACKDRWIGNLVAIQIQDRQHSPITHGIDELVGMPRRRQRPGLGLTVAHDAGDDQIGIVERHAVGVRETVAEFASFVDGARRFRRDVAPDVARKGELLEELLHPFRVFALVRINLGVGPFEVCRPQHPGRAMAGPGHENHVEVVLDDHPVQMRPRRRTAPGSRPSGRAAGASHVPSSTLLEQWVVLEIDHSHREIVARPPVAVHQLQLFVRQRPRADVPQFRLSSSIAAFSRDASLSLFRPWLAAT